MNDNMPNVNVLLKVLENRLYGIDAHSFLSDLFEISAITISNKFDKRQKEDREKKYLSILKKYEKNMQQLLCEMFAQIYVLLKNQIYIGFDDYLGELYMKSETSNNRAGQFFTPYDISKLSASIALNEEMIIKHKSDDRILKMNEPACGSGGMIIAAADILYNKYKFNISRNLFISCSDIDSRCVHMTFLQLGLAGIPAVIYKRDTLTLQTWERWETPAYVMQWTRFKNYN